MHRMRREKNRNRVSQSTFTGKQAYLFLNSFDQNANVFLTYLRNGETDICWRVEKIDVKIHVQTEVSVCR